MYTRSTTLIALCLLALLAMQPCEATFWFKESGTASSLSGCSSISMPALDVSPMWCDTSSPWTFTDAHPEVYFGTAISTVADFTWLPSGASTPESAVFTIGGNFSNSLVPQVFNNHIEFRDNSFRGIIVVEALYNEMIYPLKLSAKAARVEVRNCIFRESDNMVFEVLANGTALDYDILIDNLVMSYYNGVFTTRANSIHPTINITNSAFTQVQNPQSPSQHNNAPVFENGQMAPYKSFSLSNVNISAETGSFPSTSLALFDVVSENVTIDACYWSDLATTPGRFESKNISITKSKFYFSDTATSFGCHLCEGPLITYYNNATGVSFAIRQNVTSWFPVVSITKSSFYGVSAFEYETLPSPLKKLNVKSCNFFNRSTIFANATDQAYLDTIHFNEPPTEDIDTNVIRPPLALAGKFWTNEIYFPSGTPVTCEAVTYDGAIMIGGWLDVSYMCVTGTLTLQGTPASLFVTSALIGGMSGQVVCRVGNSLQLQGGVDVFDTEIIGAVGANVGMWKGDVNDEVIRFFGTASMSLGDEFSVDFDPDATGLTPGAVMSISPNATSISLTKTSLSGFGDASQYFAGTFVTVNSTLLTLQVLSTNCNNQCQNGGVCAERMTNCTCPQGSGFGGAWCSCSTVGIPGAASCDPRGGLKWLIPGSWDLYSSHTISVPEGYEFYIEGNCTNYGTLVLAANSTMRLGGNLVNSGQIHINSSLTTEMLSGGACQITSNTIMESSSFNFTEQSRIAMNLDATSIGDVSGCQQVNAPTIARTVFVQTSTAINASSSVAFNTNGTGSLNGTIDINVKTTATTNAKLTVAKSDPSSSTISTSLLVATTTSDSSSCATTDSTPGTLAVLISPCKNASPSKSNSKSTVKWYWYGIPIIVVGVLVVVAAIIILATPKLKTKVLPYRGTRGF